MSSQSFKGSAQFNSAASATFVVAGSQEPTQWTVKTHYTAENINPDLRVVLKIGNQSFTIAPGFETSTHTGTGTEVSYTGTFMAGVLLDLTWEITSQ